MAHEKNYYLILGVPRDETAGGIRRAFCRLARDSHPDVAGPGEKSTFHDAVEAYEVLSDPEKRRHYDASLEPPVVARPAAASARSFAGRPAAVEPLGFEPRGSAPWARAPERPAFDSGYSVEPEPLVPRRRVATRPEPEPLVPGRRPTPSGGDDALLRLLRSLRSFF